MSKRFKEVARFRLNGQDMKDAVQDFILKTYGTDISDTGTHFKFETIQDGPNEDYVVDFILENRKESLVYD